MKRTYSMAFKGDRFHNFANYSLAKKFKTDFNTVIKSENFKPNHIVKIILNIEDNQDFNLNDNDIKILETNLEIGMIKLNLASDNERNKDFLENISDEFKEMIIKYSKFKNSRIRNNYNFAIKDRFKIFKIDKDLLKTIIDNTSVKENITITKILNLYSNNYLF